MENEFLIELQARLDEAKSKGNINEDIDKIQAQLNELKLQATIDNATISKLIKQLEGILNQKITISNINIDGNGAIKTAQNAGERIGEAINKGVENSTKKAGNNLKTFSELTDFKELNKNIQDINLSKFSDYKEMLNDIKNTYSEFGQVKITNEVFKDDSLEKFKVNIEQVNGDLKETRSFIMSLDNDKGSYIFDGVINGSESVVQHLDKAKNAVNQTADAINELKAKNLADKIDLGDYDKKFETLQASYRRLGLTSDEIQSKTNDVAIALDNLKERNFDTLVQDEKEFAEALKKSQNEAAILKTDLDSIYNPKRQAKLTNDIQNWLSKNSKASGDAKRSLEAYFKELSNGRVSVARLNFISQELQNIDTLQRKLGNLGKSVFDQIKEAGSSFTQWMSISSGVMALVYQLQRVPKEVYEIDTAMTNLYKVTDETENKYKSFLKSVGDTAYNIGRSVSSLINQTAEWAKLGFDIDTASKLAETSSIYANVGEVDDSTAVKDIVTALKAFNIEAENSISIVNSLNKLGNEFATDAKSLGEGLRNSASSMAVAGNDINQTLAILTGGGEITQNVGELANGLRVVSMRLRGMKGDLQSIGEEYENIESISKIQTQIYNLTKGSVNIFKDDGSFKSTYEQLKEISEIYFDLTDSDRADLTEIMFGKNRANQGVAILQAFKSGQIEKAYEASVNSAGSAMQEQERWMDSLEAKIQQLEAVFQHLSSTIVDSDILKWFVDFEITGVKTIDSIISKFGSLGTLSAGAGLFASLKNVGGDKMYSPICFESADNNMCSLGY